MKLKRSAGFLVALSLLTASADFYTGQWIRGKDGWIFPVDEFRFYTSERPETIIDSLETIAALNSVFKSKNIDLYLSVIPIRARLYSDKLPDNLTLPDPIKERYSNTAKFFDSNEIKYVDLNMAFLNSAERLGTYPLYLKGDHHWSAPGGLLAAQLLSDKIARSEKVQADDPVEATIVRGQPTLSPKTPITPDGESPLPVQTETYLPIKVNLQSGSLLGDEYFPIAVIGDSFSNGERDGVGLFAYPSLIEATLKRRVFNAAQPGKGPWVPMSDYLKSDIYQKTAPKVINWELWETYLPGDGSGYIPEHFLEKAAMLVQGDCQPSRLPTTKNPVNIVPGNYFTVTGMGQDDSLFTSFAAQNSDSRKSFAENTDRQVMTESGITYISPSNFGPLTGIGLKAKSGAVKAPRTLHLCKLPAAVTATLSIDGKSLDYSKRNFRNQISSTNFYETNDQLTSRWALRDTSELRVVARNTGNGKITLHGYNPFDSQKINIMFNSEAIGSITMNAGYFDFSTAIKFRVGMNSLSFSFTKYRDTNGDTKKVIHDSRPLAVNFDTLVLAKP